MFKKLCLFFVITFLSTNVVSLNHNNILKSNESVEVAELLGLPLLTERPRRQLSLSNAASKFLLKIYRELSGQELDLPTDAHSRKKRSLNRGKDNFITTSERRKIEKCNNIITFASRPAQKLKSNSAWIRDLRLNFNINDVSHDLTLLQSTLRIYQDPALGIYNTDESNNHNITISIYQPIGEYSLIVTSINTTTSYKGWLRFNITYLLAKWLQYRTLPRMFYGNELLVDIMLHVPLLHVTNVDEITASDIGLVTVDTHPDLVDLQPFIIGYFNGPELVQKIQKLRYRRELIKRKRRTNYLMRQSSRSVDSWILPHPCERLNFTLDFAELQLHYLVIAPRKFEAYFCGGECNFPLSAHMNASNHAIVQTLMHLKRPYLPKPCCVPTKLGSISLLRYVNQDSVNLIKFPQSVAKECGCH